MTFSCAPELGISVKKCNFALFGLNTLPCLPCYKQPNNEYTVQQYITAENNRFRRNIRPNAHKQTKEFNACICPVNAVTVCSAIFSVAWLFVVASHLGDFVASNSFATGSTTFFWICFMSVS